MKYIIALLLMVSVASAGTEWYKIVENDGAAVKKLHLRTGKDKVLDPAKNEYPTSYSFPATNMIYWKKSGTDWVEMTQPEKDSVDADIQEEEVEEVERDEQLKAVLKLISWVSKTNNVSYAKVRQAYKVAIDPTKAKNRKNK